MNASIPKPFNWQSVLTSLALLAVCCVPTLIYQGLYATSYYPITEGWFSEYAHLIRKGWIPYTDFPLLLPPLYPLQLAAFQAIFGEQIIALRLLGMAVSCGIAVALFDILRNVFNPWIAAIAASFALFHYQMGNAFFGYDFTQFLTLYLLIAGAFLARYTHRCSAPSAPYHLPMLCVGAGLFIALAVLIKQSNGGMAAVFLGLTSLVVMFKLNRWQKALQHVAWMAFGGVIPVALMLGWLASVGALDKFFSSIVTDALASKGGVGIIAFKWVGEFFQWPTHLYLSGEVLGQLAMIIGGIVFMSCAIGFGVSVIKQQPMQLKNIMQIFFKRDVWLAGHAPMVIGLFATVMLCALILLIYYQYCAWCVALAGIGQLVYNQTFFWSVYLYVIGFIVALIWFLLRPEKNAALTVVIFGLGLGLTFGNGTSAGLSEISTFVGVSLLFAWLMQLAVPFVLPAIIPLALWLCLSALLIEQKFQKPYHWWSVESGDARHKSCADSKGILSGICVPDDQYTKMQRITDDILRHSKPDEPIYVFPHIPIFYLLADRLPFAGGVVSWFDFMSDRQAIELSQKLRDNPPPVIVVADLDELVLTTHERLFRNKQPLGQRQILNVITQLEKQRRIKRIDTVENLNGVRAIVYVRISH